MICSFGAGQYVPLAMRPLEQIMSRRRARHRTPKGVAPKSDARFHHDGTPHAPTLSNGSFGGSCIGSNHWMHF